MTRVDVRARSPDLRLGLLGATAWAAVAAGLLGPRWLVAGLALCLVVLAIAVRRIGAAAIAIMFAAGAAVADVHEASLRASPVRALAADQAAAVVVLEVRTPAMVVRGRFGDRVRFEAAVLEVRARGQRHRGGGRVNVVTDAVGETAVGVRIRLRGLFLPARGPDTQALLVGRGPPEVLRGPDVLDAAVNRVRGAVRGAATGHGAGPAALVPALVDGDEGGGGGTGAFADDFRTAGMTHLLAVSGTNLTIILGGLLLLARWCRVRAHGLTVVGLVGVVGFVLLAGPEPSVLRAAAMGTVGVIALGRSGPGNGVRALGLAVLVLVLLVPALAVSLGFVLSVVATGGILLLGPGLRDALARWSPRWAAEAMAVPIAAQLACTPVVAAFSGQVSLVAVVANIAAAPFVAPATVLGLLGGLLALVWMPLGQIVAAPACWSAGVIIEVARRAADLPVPAVEGVRTAVGLGLVLAVTVALAKHLPGLLRRPSTTLVVTGLLGAVVLVPVPVPGWPPRGWVMVGCDVGQGDALVLRTGPGSGIVVDTGPDPRSIDRCLRRLGIESVPVLVITHFHADHVDGVAGVMRGRTVGRIDVSPLPEPAAGAAAVRSAALRGRVPVRVVAAGERTRVGSVRWQVLGPLRAHPESASPPNDASVVMLVETAGVRVLMLGDAEPPEQADLRSAWPNLRADVLKLAHHGSARQDEALVAGLGARVAVVSAGRDNDYGHPAPAALALVGRAGMRVLRTDQDGDVALVVRDGTLATVRRGVAR